MNRDESLNYLAEKRKVIVPVELAKIDVNNKQVVLNEIKRNKLK